MYRVLSEQTGKFLGLAILTYLLGYFHFSFTWTILVIFLFSLFHKTDEETQQTIEIGPEKAKENNTEWLNKIIQQAWMQITHYIRDVALQTIQDMPGVKINKIFLGNTPLRISKIKVYDAQKDKVLVDADFSYSGDSRVKFYYRGLPVEIKNFKAQGSTRLLLQPLIPVWPMVGGLKVSVLKEPKIDFDLVFVMPYLGNISGVKRLIRNYILSYAKETYAINLTDEISEFKALISEPDGVLRVQVVGARDLANDMDSIGVGKPDPYVILSLGNKTCRTPTILDSFNPTWNFWSEFEAPEHGILEVEVWDKDDLSEDDCLGSAKVAIGGIVKNLQSAITVPLNSGEIHLRLYWMPLSKDHRYLDMALKEAQLLSPDLHSAILFVYAGSAQTAATLDHYLSVSLEDQEESREEAQNFQKESSGVVKNSKNPTWNESFSFLVKNPKTSILKMKIMDEGSEMCLEEFSFNIDNLVAHSGMEIDRSFTTQSYSLFCAMKLRAFRTKINIDEIDGPVLVNSEEGAGKIEMTISFSSEERKLTVVVHQVQFSSEIKIPSDLYVKLYLLPDRHEDSKRRTKVLEGFDTTFNESFEYFISPHKVESLKLEATVAMERKMYRNEIVGQAVVDLEEYMELTQSITEWLELKPKVD